MVTVKVENDNLEGAIRKFRREVEREGILDEYKSRRYFEKPSAKKHRADVLAKHNALIEKKKAEKNH